MSTAPGTHLLKGPELAPIRHSVMLFDTGVVTFLFPSLFIFYFPLGKIKRSGGDGQTVEAVWDQRFISVFHFDSGRIKNACTL